VQILSEQVAQDINGTYSAYFNLTSNKTPEDSVIILVADYVKLGREFNSVAAEIRKEIPNIQIGGLALGKAALWAKNNKRGIDGTHDNNHIDRLTERLERELL
ncbi:MAG: hypothetical protein P8M53_06585, partial [Pirellulales bacterium]|nr:hypothetical protein [Pirellulales bacterium]